MISSPLGRAAILVAAATSQVFAQYTFPNTTTCDAACQNRTVEVATWITEQQSDPEFAFYEVPSKFSSKLAPGTVLTVEVDTNLTNYVVPGGLTMSRIIYTTEDLNGTVLPASAYVLWPYSPINSQSNNIPMVAWAHGTTGTFKPCTPSSYRALQYHFQVPFAIALQGMAVVAPDYAGLGVSELPSGETIPHPWITAPAHAKDLAHAITAARSAFPDMLKSDGPFVAMGHSQGGGASWSFAERQASKPLKGYKGTVTLAPVTRILDDLSYFLSQKIPAAILYAQGAVIDSISKTYPSYNYAGLTDESYDRWHNVLARVQGCFPVLFKVYQDIDPTTIAKPNWYNASLVKTWADRVQAGRKALAGPLLVLNGDDDNVVRPQGVDSTVNDTCSLIQKSGSKTSIEHVTYTAMDHFEVIQASQTKWMGWIKDRLAGKTVSSTGCTSSVTTGMRTDFTVKGSAPNFFLSFFDTDENWKYGL